MKNFWIFIGSLFVIFVIVCVYLYSNSLIKQNIKTEQIKLGDRTITVEIADTSALRERGLSGRNSLSEGSGMLFIFSTPGDYGFWMKEMNFPLDIVWINAKKQEIGVEKNVSPSTYPQVFHPPSPIKYVLELPAGDFDRHPFTAL